jgi:hypothetical protein
MDLLLTMKRQRGDMKLVWRWSLYMACLTVVEEGLLV